MYVARIPYFYILRVTFRKTAFIELHPDVKPFRVYTYMYRMQTSLQNRWTLPTAYQVLCILKNPYLKKVVKK